jgi:D-3-phosphoglycerate dehydrogenase
MKEVLDLYVTLSTFAEADREPLKMLEQSGLRFGINRTGKRPSAAEVMASCGSAKVLVAGVETYDEAVLSQLHARGLRCISRCGSGTENIDLAAATRLGIHVFNTPDETVPAVAEHTLCLILAMLRRLPELDRDTKGGRWKRHTGNLLQEKTVGLVGYGRIGRRVAQLVEAFNARCLVLDPMVRDIPAGLRANSLEELLAGSDIVSLHCPAGAVRLGKRELALMRKPSWLVNTARGDLVEEQALVESLTRGQLAGAAVDVYPREPYEGPWLSTSGFLLTPHQSTLTMETRTRMECRAIFQSIAFLQGGRES